MLYFLDALTNKGREDKGHSELANTVSWVSPYLPFHLPLTDWVYCGYFSPWPSTNKYNLQNLHIEAFLMTTFTTSYFLIPLSHGVGQTKTSTSPCIQGVIYEVLTVWWEATEREFYQRRLSAPSTVKVSWTTRLTICHYKHNCSTTVFTTMHCIVI